MSAYPYQDRFPVNRTLPEHGRPRAEVLAEMRTLAEEAGISPGTAAKVYRELEAGGVLEGRGRSGTFVAETDAAATP